MPVAARRRPRLAVPSIFTAALLVALGLVPAAASAADPSASPSPSPAAVPTPSVPPTPGSVVWPTAAAGPTPIGAAVTLFGRGSGHGVGMSQYGARGRALAGQDAATILTHYYANTTLAARDPATPVRVLLASGLAATATNPLRVTGLNGAWTIDGLGASFPAGASVALTGSLGAWLLTVTAADGSLLAAAPAPGDLRVRPADAATVLAVSFKPSTRNVYRGAIRLLATTRVVAINEVPLDEYLRGVVPVEMPYLWPAEALKAQSIAARSFAVRRLHPATGAFDVYDDGRSQIYYGVRYERPSVNAAIDGTAGLVLMIGSAVANTVYHSAGGGATENSEFVWTSPTGTVVNRPAPELRGSSDLAPDGTRYDAASPSMTWRTATYTQAQFSAIFAADARTNVGTVLALDLSRRGVSGRLIAVTLIGTAGTKTVSGMLFQGIFNVRRPPGHPILRSTLFDLAPIPPGA